MPDRSISALDDRFRRGDAVRIVGVDGAPVVAVTTAAADARIALQGAHLLSWRPAGQQEVLWLSPLSPIGSGKAIRGGIPVCWPWFGPHAGDRAKPQHGFARNADWALDGVDVEGRGDGAEVALRFTLPAAEPLRRQMDGFADVSLALRIGRELSMTLATRNAGNMPLIISEALHTYFQVSDARHVRVLGLEGARYRDNADGGKLKTQDGAVTIAGETVRLFDDAPDAAVIEDTGLGRRIRISRSGGRSTVVWNPADTASAIADIAAGGQWRFVCVESGNIGAAAKTIAPAASAALGIRYRVEAL